MIVRFLCRIIRFMKIMNKNSFVDLPDDSLQIKLLFARTMSISPHPFMPMRDAVYHALCVQRFGGPIHTVFEDEPEHVVTRTKGSVCLLPAGRKRRVEVCNVFNDPSVDITVAALAFKLFGELDYLSLWEVPVMFDHPTGECLRHCCERLVELESDIRISPLKKLALRQACCWEILERIVSVSRPRADVAQRLSSYRSVAPALKILERDFRQALRIEDLAGICSLSRTQFHYQFKRITGCSPMEYQQRLRLTEARRLLVLSDDSVAEVGERVGWTDQFHFSRIFKKACACSPVAFRKKLRRGCYDY